MSILSEMLEGKHRESLQAKQYKLEAARQMIDSEAKQPGTFDPKMIQMAADTLQMGVVPKEHEGGFHRALGMVLPHIFGSKPIPKPANEGAISSGGSAAPQAAMMPMPAPPTTDPGLSSPILSMNAPQMQPPPGGASPMPPLPDSSQGQPGNGAAPIAPQDPTTPGNPSQGFTSLGVTPATTTPPPARPLLRNGVQAMPFHVNSYAERVAANAPGVRSQAALDLEIANQKAQAALTRLQQIPGFDQLTPRQKLSAVIGQNISPELRPANLPGMVHGKDIPDATIDAFGAPVDKDSMYRVRLSPDGTREYFPEVASSITREIIDPKDGKSYIITQDRTGHEINRREVVNKSAIPITTTSSSSGVRIVPQADGSIAAVPVTTTNRSTRQRVMPGVQPAAGTAIPPPPGGNRTVGQVPPAGAGAPGRTIGQSPSMTRMLAENQYTPQAQAAIQDTEPKLDAISRLKKALEPYKNDNTPFATLIPRIAYAVGVDPKDMGGFLSQLELNRIGSAARLLKGTSRSGTILEKAMVHTPDAWKDSGKLMYGKLTEIETALNDILKTTRKNGQKYPGLDRGTQGMTPPPAAETWIRDGSGRLVKQ